MGQRAVVALCGAEIPAMSGTMTFQALSPLFIAGRGLSNSDAGWISWT